MDFSALITEYKESDSTASPIWIYYEKLPDNTSKFKVQPVSSECAAKRWFNHRDGYPSQTSPWIFEKNTMHTKLMVA